MGLAAVHQGHHQQLGAVANALDLQPHKFIAALAQGLGGTPPLLLHQAVNRLTQGRASDADKPPGLHQADAGGLVRGFEQAREYLGSHLAAAEMAHIAAFGDGAVHRGTLLGTKGLLVHQGSPGRNSAAAARGADGR